MIVADKRVLEANLKKGSLAIQYKLVFLFTENLNALATNAALIAGLSMVGLWETSYVTGNIPDWIFGFIYYFIISVSLISGLLSYCQGSLEVIWGPVVALSGENHGEVSEATSRMETQQEEGIMWGAVSCLTLILAIWIFILAQSGVMVAIPITLVVFYSMYMIITEGKKAREDFRIRRKGRGGSDYTSVEEGDSDDETSSDDDENPSKKKNVISTLKKAGNTILSGNVSNMKEKEEGKALRYKEQKTAILQQVKDVKGRGWIWSRSLHIQTTKKHSDCFHKGYIVVENGRLDMFENEEDYVQHKNPCNTSRILLGDYHLELDPRIIARHTPTQLSATSALRGALTGTQEISFQDSLTVDFDVQFAIKNLKFSLIPRKISELKSTECLHFLAEDETMLRQWVSVLRKLISLFREFDVIEEKERSGRGSEAVSHVAVSASAASPKKK